MWDGWRIKNYRQIGEEISWMERAEILLSFGVGEILLIRRTKWRIEKEEWRKERKVEKKEKGKRKKKERSDRWGRERKSNLTRLVGPSNVCLFTKMPWKLSFHNLKTPKSCFQFPNLSFKNQRIEWWKQKLKTNPNKPNNRGTHQFWVMGDGKQQIQIAP